MKKALALLAAAAALNCLAADPAAAVLEDQNRTLTAKLDTCSIQVSTIYALIRGRQPPDPSIDPVACIADGKEYAKAALAKVRAAARKEPADLADWRVEWMTAFDAAMPQAGEREADYHQRVNDAKNRVSRLSNRLQIAFE